jgi:hypothetical protein
MNDRVRRMYNEARDRLHDADILSRSLATVSDSQAIIRILAFEVLLKCALLVAGQQPKNTHNYKSLCTDLPPDAQREVLAVAAARMPGHADLSDVEKLLIWYRFIFEKARYHYELYEGYTLEEQGKLGEYWEKIGAPTEEAVVQYYPSELECLIEGLTRYVEKAL